MPTPTTIRFFIVMGVSGSGKSSVGRALAARLGWDFYDADDFPPPANIAKMSSGIPLSDEDRAPWLASLRDLVFTSLQHHRPAVLACSALKESYRQTLQTQNPAVRLVYLKGSYAQIEARMAQRENHYMKPAMLQSQFLALEEPHNAQVLSVELSIEELVSEIMSALR